MTERILIVGGAGYIGSHAAKAVRAAGREPVVFDDLSAGHAHAVKWGPLVKGDVRNAEAVRSAIREYRPKAVMQFAARIEVGEGEKNPAHFYDNNVAGTLNLVRVMLEEGVNNLVFSSTCAIYGDPERLPLTEDLPKRPVSVYGRTKLMCEQMLEDMGRAHGLNFAALRYFNAAGADPDGEAGEEHSPETHLIPNALKAAAGLGGAMRLFGTDYPTPDGTCVRDFVHVTDLAEAHVLAADRIAGGESVQLNLGTGEGRTVKQVLGAVARATGRAVPVEVAGRRAGDAVALYADATKVRATLGWRPRLSDIDTVVSTAWSFHRRVWGVGLG